MPVAKIKSRIPFSPLAPIIWAASASSAVASEGPKIGTIIDNVIDLIQRLTVVVWLIALMVFGWGIVRLIAAAGNPEKIKEAKSIIWWGLIGLFILTTMIGIILFVQTFFGLRGVQIIKAPQF